MKNRAQECRQRYREEVLKRKASEAEVDATVKKIKRLDNKVRLANKKQESIKQLKTQLLTEKLKVTAVARANDRCGRFYCLLNLILYCVE